MFFKKKSNVIFRNYDSFGYLTDNRNFGYKQTHKNINHIGDKILSQSGAVFMSVLDRNPQAIEALVQKINLQFPDIDIRTIQNDAIEFYSMLERDGFVVSGITLQKCEEKDRKFSYETVEPVSVEKYSSKKSTQDFLEEYFKGKPQLTNLHIEIISKCNEKCIHCYIPHDSKISQMEADLFYEIILQSKKMRLLHLTLSGGEPMLHKNFIDFLRKCNENDFSVNVLSNLTLLDDEIIREMKTNPLLSVQVSLYSMNSDIHDEITQVKGSFNKTINAILKLIENNIPLQISCPIMKQNKNCYPEVINWAEKNKIHVGDDFGIIASYNHTSQNLGCRLSIDEIYDVINDKITSDISYLHQIEMAAEKKKNTLLDDSVCSVCHSSICIADNGNVYPCAGWQDFIVGNVKETPLIDIWDYSDNVQYLRSLRNQDFSKCIHCLDKEFCTMCLVRNANENPQGNPLVVNEYFCDIARLNKKFVLEWKGKN